MILSSKLIYLLKISYQDNIDLLASKPNTLEFNNALSPITCGSDIHILEFSVMLSSNPCKSSEMPNLTPLGLTTHWTQLHVSMTRSRSNIIRFSYVLSSNVFKYDTLSNSISLGSATQQTQIHISLVRCWTQYHL